MNDMASPRPKPTLQRHKPALAPPTVEDIREMIAGQAQAAPAQAAEPVPERRDRRDRFEPVPEHFADTEQTAGAQPADGPSLFARMTRGMPNLRGKGRYLIWGLLCLFAVLRPWLVVGLVVFAVILLIGALLILGFDEFWEQVAKLVRWYGKRRPQRAVALHRMLDGFAMTWDGILDRFPESWVDGLYLPDFSELEAAAKRAEAAHTKRFADMQGDKA